MLWSGAFVFWFGHLSRWTFDLTIIYKFIKAKRESTQNSTSESTSQALSKYALKGTAMVLTISIMFIVLTTPVAIDQITARKLTPYPLYYVFMVSMQYLNHSINGFLYCIVGTKFRQELSKLLKCCCVKYDDNTTNLSINVTHGTDVAPE